jgi:hypothetical protein
MIPYPAPAALVQNVGVSVPVFAPFLHMPLIVHNLGVADESKDVVPRLYAPYAVPQLVIVAVVDWDCAIYQDTVVGDAGPSIDALIPLPTLSP